MLQAFKDNIPLLPAHLVGPSAVAFEVLVYLDGGVPRASSSFRPRTISPSRESNARAFRPLQNTFAMPGSCRRNHAGQEVIHGSAESLRNRARLPSLSSIPAAAADAILKSGRAETPAHPLAPIKQTKQAKGDHGNAE